MAAKENTKNSNKESPKVDDIFNEPESAEKAGDNKKSKKERKQKKRKGTAGKLVPILILVLIIGAVAGILGFNLFNIRDKYLSGMLKNIPIVGNLLPAETSTDGDSPYSGMTNDELIAEINKLTSEMEKQQQDMDSLDNLNKSYTSEISRLKDIESQYVQIKNDKAEFDRMIAENDPNAYAKFYESISPENAAELYKQAVMTVQNAKDIRNYVATFSNMEPSSAAAVLEQMLTTDMDLVSLIVGNMDSVTAAEILQAMDAKNAASVQKRLAPTPVPELVSYPPSSDVTTEIAPTETPTPTP